MKNYQLIGSICCITGLILLSLSIITGEVTVGIIIIFPIIMGTGVFAITGILLFIAGFLLISFGWMTQTVSFHQDHIVKEKTQKRVQSSGIILIGPLPIIWGSNWKIMVFLIVLAIILLLLGTLVFTQVLS